MRIYAHSKKMMSVMIAAAFMLSTFAPFISSCDLWAENIPDATQSVKELNADTFALPRELGYIKESLSLPNSIKTVIHIQDAHCNYAAQQKISEILNYLTDEYGISAVNCEGAAKDYDLSPFTVIPEKDIRRKTSDYFVKEGLVSAAEYFAVNNPEKINLWGVEDADLYMKNLKVYRESLGYRAEVERYMRSIGRVLDNLKKHIYSPELLEFDNSYTRYKDGKIGFKEYLTYVVSAANKSMIDTKSFPDVYLLSQTLNAEDRIDFKRANSDKDEVVEALKKVLSRSELEELMRKVAHVKIGRISQGDFYAYLNKKSKSIKLDLKNYPELKKYIIYISIYSAVDKSKVAKELDMMEDKIRVSLCVNDAQRELSTLSKNLALEKNMFNISLTRDDYVYYRENRAGFAATNFIRFIDKYAPIYKMRTIPYENVRPLDRYREKIEVFYECSLERDKAFVRNIRFTDHGRPSSIIITGGFHTESLRELFKNENVSYISIMPKFTNPSGYVSPYLKRLAGQRTSLENAIDTAIPAVLNLQVFEILSKEIALKVEGPARLNQFKLAVMIKAALVRGEQFLFKVSRTAYPEKFRPAEDKIIVFLNDGGGNVSYVTVSSVTDPVRYAQLAEREDLYGLDKIGPNDFEFSLVSASPKAPVAEAAPEKAPAIAVVTPAPKKGMTQEELVKIIGQAAPIYGAAQDIAPEIGRIMRRGSPTYLVSPVPSSGDIAGTASNSRTAEQILGKDGHEIHAKSYLAEGDWMKNIKKPLKRSMTDFIRDAESNSRTRMAIRVIADGREISNIRKIKGFMKGFLMSAKGYQREDADNFISKYVRFVPVRIENIEHLNPAIDLFVDIGMMECDRYIQHDYTGELPAQLRDNFLALLKLSITNFEELAAGKDVNEILQSIFRGYALRIRPIDWESIEKWKKGQDLVLRSL